MIVSGLIHIDKIADIIISTWIHYGYLYIYILLYDNFIILNVDERTKGSSVLDLTFANRSGVGEEVKVVGTLGQRERERDDVILGFIIMQIRLVF